jgi:hypothetical protein
MYPLACVRCRAPQSPSIAEVHCLVRSLASLCGHRASGPVVPYLLRVSWPCAPAAGLGAVAKSQTKKGRHCGALEGKVDRLFVGRDAGQYGRPGLYSGV